MAQLFKKQKKLSISSFNLPSPTTPKTSYLFIDEYFEKPNTTIYQATKRKIQNHLSYKLSRYKSYFNINFLKGVAKKISCFVISFHIKHL